MHIVSQFPFTFHETPDMGIPMPDGCRLSARVWMPDVAKDAPVPAILEYIPYRKRDGTTPRDEVMHKYFAGHGYAVIRLDMRGNGDSQGLMRDEYTQSELDDGCAAIAWLAAQPWCSGSVGMMGKSWGGFNCLQVAAMDPPALKAIITVCSTVDRYADDIHYKGGCLLGDNFAWGSQMLSYSSRPPDPMLVGASWRDMWLNRLEHEPFLAIDWLSHQTRDAYWQHGSVCEDYAAITAAVLTIGGWADNYMNTIAHLVENIQSPVKGIVGPWVHQYPHQADPAPRIGFLQEAVRWWDHWLKDVPNGAEDDPAYRVFMQESVRPSRTRNSRAGRWVAEKNWPSPRQHPWSLVLGQKGTLGADGCDICVPVSSPFDCGFGTGSYFPMSGAVPQMPGEQRDDDARSACFETEPLSDAVEILGAPEIRLRLSCDQPVGQIAVRLCEVHPDGASSRVTYGVLNLCHHESHESPSDLTPDAPFEVRFTLDQIAMRINPGMRLRVAVSSAYWPFLWPNSAQTIVTLLGGEITLPCHDGPTTNEWTFDEPEGATPWEHEVLRPAEYRATKMEDQASGDILLEIFDDEGLSSDKDHGLIHGAITRYTRRINPHDPLSAQAKIHWTQEIAREDWSVRTETRSEMHADATHYHLSASIEAYEGDTLVFEKTFQDSIPRLFS